MIPANGISSKTTDKARALVAAGRVRLTDGGASVTNDGGFIYRVDFDLGGHPHCQCRGFEYRGWCKHLTAAYMALAQAEQGRPEDEEPTQTEYAAWLDGLTADELEAEYHDAMRRDDKRRSDCFHERQAGNWYELPAMPERDAAIATAYWVVQ